MSKVKNYRVSLVGLCVTTACVLMTFAASAAQAETGAQWMVGGVNITPGLTVDTRLTPESITFENGTGTETANVLLLLAETALGPIWIGCKKGEGSGTLEANGGGTGRVDFTECSTSIKQSGHMKLSAVCKPVEPIETVGKALIKLHQNVPYIHLEGIGGKFGAITIPEGCPFEGRYDLKGLILVEDCENQFEAEQLSHLLKEAMGATLALSKGLIFGAFPAAVDGSAILELFESGVMKTFSGLAK